MASTIVFNNVLTMLIYMLCGFLLVKTKKMEADHAKSISAFLVYVCGSCMVIGAFQSMEYSLDLFASAMIFFAATLLIQLLFFVLLYIILNKKLKNPQTARYRILAAGSTMGNVGFFGLPLVTSLFPDQPLVACYSTLYVTSMNLLVFTLGVYLITNDKKFISVKAAVLNPTFLSTLVAVPLYLLQFHFPSAIGNAVSMLGKVSTPVCMLVLGMRLASMEFKKTFTRPIIYVICVMKLIVFPLFAYGCVYFLPFVDETFKICVFVLSAAPTASVVLTLAEVHECERKMCANVVSITTLLSVITIPLMMLIVT